MHGHRAEIPLPACRLDLEKSPTFRRQLRRLLKKYPHLKADLERLRPIIEQDYQCKKAHATRLQMPNQPSVQGKVWKYDLASSDLEKACP